jgi:ribonuclease P protein component
MLPKENRLKNKKDFESVFKNGKGFKEGFFYLKIKKNNLELSRFGFVVSKKISKSAVVRNKIKRAIRNYFRFNIGSIKKGLDGVLVVVSQINKEGFDKIEDNLRRVLKKSDIFSQ